MTRPRAAFDVLDHHPFDPIMTPPTNVLDHIIHLSPPGKLSEAVAQWEQLGFRQVTVLVVPGGQHADGLTSNSLVSFADGVYLELIAFDKPASDYPPDSPRSKHWWANKEPGWIDWAFLGLEDHVDRTIAAREKEAGSGVKYQEGQVGGRKRASDGKELKWRVTFPETKHGRGTVPFFCQDLTPRDLRVPAADNDTHPNTAVGISHLRLAVPSSKVEEVKAQLTVVLGTTPNESNEWELALPHTVTNLDKTVPSPRLKLVTSSYVGVEEVGFYVTKAKGQVDTPKGFGKVVFVEV